MIPALIGAGISLAGAINNASEAAEKRRNTEAAYNQLNQLTNKVYNANNNDIDSYKGLINATYGQGVGKYNDALDRYLNSDTPQVQDDYSYIGSVNEFLDPAAQQRQDAAMNAIRSDSGDIFSSDYYNRMAAKQQALASDEYAKAWDRMNADRTQNLNEFNTNSQNTWNNYNAVQQKLKDAVQQYGNDRNSLVNGIGDATIAGMNNRTGTLQTQANQITGLTNAQNQQQSGFGSFLGPLMQFAGSYFGGS